MKPAEVKLKEYYALIQLINGILSRGKSSQGNKVMMEKTIKRGWRVVSQQNLGICQGLLNFDSIFGYFVGIKFYKIKKLNCSPFAKENYYAEYRAWTQHKFSCK